MLVCAACLNVSVLTLSRGFKPHKEVGAFVDKKRNAQPPVTAALDKNRKDPSPAEVREFCFTAGTACSWLLLLARAAVGAVGTYAANAF